MGVFGRKLKTIEAADHNAEIERLLVEGELVTNDDGKEVRVYPQVSPRRTAGQTDAATLINHSHGSTTANQRQLAWRLTEPVDWAPGLCAWQPRHPA